MDVKTLIELLKTPLGIIQLGIILVMGLCVFLIILAVLIDFIEFHKRKNTKKGKKSIVETGTMFLFFLIYYCLIRFEIGSFKTTNLILLISLVVIGLALIVIGCYVNIRGRIDLGKNWANQIKIYKDHILVTKGMYRFVRHPLYASLIWMFYGGSLVYLNYAAFIATSLIFVPFMYYRAKQEEKLLLEEFKNYKQYLLKVGMFFPKLI